MKKLLVFIFIVLSVTAFSQSVVNRAGKANTVADQRLMAILNLFVPQYLDTTTVDKGIDSCGAIIWTRDNKLWVRNCNPKHWTEVGSGGASNGSTTVKSFASIAALQASHYDTTSSALIALLQGYIRAGDGGGYDLYWDSESSATEDGIFVIKPNHIATDEPGRWLKIFNGIVRALEAGIKNDGSDQTSRLNAVYANASVNTVLFDNGSFTISGAFNGQNKKTQFNNGAKLTGSGSATNLWLDIASDFYQKIFDTTLTLTGAITSPETNPIWFGATPDYNADGSNPLTATDNQRYFYLALQALRQNVPTSSFYIYKNKFHIPQPQGVDKCFYLARCWNVNADVEVYGDGPQMSRLVFPTGLGTPAVWVNMGLGAKDVYMHDLSVWGAAPQTSQLGGGGLYDNASHGIKVDANNCKFENVWSQYFRGNGWYVFGNTGGDPVTNANNCTFDNIKGDYNSGSGIAFKGPDANSCRVSNSDFSLNARWGCNDDSFLGNQFFGVHTSSNGTAAQWGASYVFNSGAVWVASQPQVRYVTNGGSRYRCILGYNRVQTSDAVAAPGTGSSWMTYWTLVGAGGANDKYWDYYDYDLWEFIATPVSPFHINSDYWQWIGNTGSANPPYYPQYVDTLNYCESGGFLSSNDNQRATFTGCYSELDQHRSTNRGSSIFTGGYAANDGNLTGGIGMIQGRLGSKNFFAYDGFVNTESADSTANIYKGILSSTSGASGLIINGGFNYNTNAFVGWAFSSAYGSDSSGSQYGLGSGVFSNTGAIQAWDQKAMRYGRNSLFGRNTSSFGSDFDDNGDLLFSRGFFARQKNSGTYRQVEWNTSYDSTHYHAVGDMIYNVGTDRNIIWWICSVAGNPATWVAIEAGGGSGNPNSNIGSGDRWAVPFTNNIKTAHAGFGILIDSTEHSDELTFTLDTTNLPFYNFPVRPQFTVIDGGADVDTLALAGIENGAWGTPGQVLVVNGTSDGFEWATISGSSGWDTSGNTVGANGRYIGTNDDYDFTIKRNGNQMMKFDGTSITAGNSFPNQLSDFKIIYYTGSYATDGLLLQNEAGPAIRLHAIAGGMYITDAAGAATGLVLGTWVNASDPSTFTNSPGNWTINAGNFNVTDLAGTGTKLGSIGSSGTLGRTTIDPANLILQGSNTLTSDFTLNGASNTYAVNLSNITSLTVVGNNGHSISGTTISLTASSGAIALNGGQIIKRDAITSTSTLTINQYYIEADATSGNITITFPSTASMAGNPYVYVIKRVDASVNTVTIAAGSGQTVELAANTTILTRQSKTFIWNATATDWEAN